MEKQIAKDIFDLSEEKIYEMLKPFKTNQTVDQSLVYCFIKAFYIHIIKLYLNCHKSNLKFEVIYKAYKEDLKLYYKINNPNIENELLDQILNFFDNSFNLINSIKFNQLEDNYEFRHYTINTFELLRMILENKSKAEIRTDIFDFYIRIIVAQKEEILDYMGHKKLL